MMKNMIFFFLTLLSTGFISFSGHAQFTQPLQVSGIAIDSDLITPVPYASVTINSSLRGTTTDQYGHFNLKALPGDTIRFSSVGYEDCMYILPALLEGEVYTLIQTMDQDTRVLEEVTIFSFPSAEALTKAILEYSSAEKDYEYTRQGQDLQQLLEENEILAKYAPRDYGEYDHPYARLYAVYGLVPENNLLNPLVWSELIRDIKAGKFKEK
jgi:hypothetical protein